VSDVTAPQTLPLLGIEPAGDLSGTLTLSAGDSYRVPKGAEHVFRVTETLTAVEVTTPATNK